MNLRPRRATAMLCASAFVLASCQSTPIALVDAAYGHEHVLGSRTAHIESMRVLIEEPVAAGDSTAHRFTLRIVLDNRAKETWVVRRQDLVLEVCTGKGHHCPEGVEARLVGTEPILVTLAPGSSTLLAVPIEIVVRAPNTLREMERFPIDLELRDGTNDLLHRRIGIGVFHQAGQAVRLVVVFTGALLVLSLL